MPKPTRKHPGFHSLTESPQGAFFVRLLTAFLGDDLVWKPLEQTADKAHVFLLRGPRGVGLLVETREQAEDDCWRQEHGFRCALLDAHAVINIDLVTYRWDPWLSARKTGDRTLIEGPARRRYKAQAEKNREIGSRRDTLRVAWLPQSDAPPTLAGVPYATVMASARRTAAGIPFPP
jgi:hypothetical protein